MKDFENALRCLKGSKVIDYKALYEALAHKPWKVLDKEAELIYKICEWRINDNR